MRWKGEIMAEEREIRIQESIESRGPIKVWVRTTRPSAYQVRWGRKGLRY